MKKDKAYSSTRFSVDVLRTAINQIEALPGSGNEKPDFRKLTVEHDDATWHHDSPDEFFADYRKYNSDAHIYFRVGRAALSFWAEGSSATVWVEGATRAEIESIFCTFESARAGCKVETPQQPKAKPTVFIGHGRSSQWRDLKDHLIDKHGYQIEAFETGARAGHTIRDILEEMANRSSFAVLVLTGEDQQEDGTLRARQNVIHEAGLFQGRLGFSRAIMLLEAGVERFSNVHGVQHISYSASNIKETFGEVLATLRREFGE